MVAFIESVIAFTEPLVALTQSVVALVESVVAIIKSGCGYQVFGRNLQLVCICGICGVIFDNCMRFI